MLINICNFKHERIPYSKQISFSKMFFERDTDKLPID